MPRRSHPQRDRPLLLESGRSPQRASASGSGLSAAGVRRHLDALIEAGDAEATRQRLGSRRAAGRPAKRYRLTAAGRAKLEHTYDDLASAAMRQLREIGGEEAVRTFARRRIDTILAGVKRRRFRRRCRIQLPNGSPAR